MSDAPVNTAALLARLQPLLARLAPDLSARAEDPAVTQALRAEHAEELKARRTADPYEVWLDFRVTQVAAAWLLSLLFVRTLEDRGLIPARLRGGADHRAQLRALAPYLNDRDYLLLVFREMTRHRAVAEVFDAQHNPVWTLSPSPDMAAELLQSCQSPEGLGGFALSGDTRFLGDVYEQLDEGVRARYALLQTPDFVESFILDRCLTPALDERGVQGLSLIDPTCGSGHFVLGAFRRLFEAWGEADPGADAELRAFRAVEQVYGVDINPYAVAIARFRLALAYLEAAGLDRLEGARDLKLNLAVADSLLPVRGEAQQSLADWGGVSGHAGFAGSVYRMAQSPEAQRVLGGRRFDVVVGNPPYITVKDEALRDKYRDRYDSASGKYQLVVPFVERFFELAREDGWVGAIVGNGFMKRNFGRKLIEDFLPKRDLTCIIDTSGAFIPGHGTPTVLLFGRQRGPTDTRITAVLGKRGEPSTPEDPAQGLVWRSIAEHWSDIGYDDEYVSVERIKREVFETHPWAMKGGGALTLKERIEEAAERTLGEVVEDIGFASFPGQDDAFVVPHHVASGRGFSSAREFITGESVRDWALAPPESALAPYDSDHEPIDIRELPPPEQRHFWSVRELVGATTSFGGRTRKDNGEPYWTWYRWQPTRYASAYRITFAFVATHNHFVLDRGGKVFNRSAPIIKLPDGASEEEHLALLGYLNSSLACFWMKMVFFPKYGAQKQDHPDPARFFYEFAATGLAMLPIPANLTEFAAFAGQADAGIQQATAALGEERLRAQLGICTTANDVRKVLRQRWIDFELGRREAVAAQEEIDWRVYRQMGIVDNDALVWHLSDKLPPMERGQRAFEKLAGRQSFVRKGGELLSASDAEEYWAPTLETTHEVGELSVRRAQEIQTNRWLRMFENPIYKRLWRDSEQNEMEAAYRQRRDTANLSRWMLDTIESHLQHQDTPQSARQLARALHADPKLRAVAEVLTKQPDPDLEALFTELVQSDAVPYLAAMRYKASGLKKYRLWQQTWGAQRAEDAWEAAGGRGPRPKVPLPPKYGSGDFARAEYWRLRGKLDVPKERFLLYPGVETESDPTPRVGWAGWDHAARMAALGGLAEAHSAEPERLQPLLAGMLELLPWVQQWHGEDMRYGTPLGAMWAEHIEGTRVAQGWTEADLRGWRPEAKARGRKAAGGDGRRGSGGGGRKPKAAVAEAALVAAVAAAGEGGAELEGLMEALGESKARVSAAAKLAEEGGRLVRVSSRPLRWVVGAN